MTPEATVADNPEIRDYRDMARINMARINMNEPNERAYWQERFGVSGQRLAAAVRDMGVSVATVEKYVAKKKEGCRRAPR